MVAEGMAIFVHVAGATCSTIEPPPYFGRTEEEMRACASTAFDEGVGDFQVIVDGQDVAASLDAYRSTSPLFTMTFPADGIFGIRTVVGQSVSEAISFIIAPPPPGEYEITVSGKRLLEVASRAASQPLSSSKHPR